jgi:hypothetical protein
LTLGWQRVLDRHADLFAEVAPGASAGIIPRYSRLQDGTRRMNVKVSVPPLPMTAWVREAAGMRARQSEFRGLKGLEADLLLVADDGAEACVLAHEHPLGELTRALRDGRMLFMVLRSRNELRNRGWSELFERLGLPFQGTCR